MQMPGLALYSFCRCLALAARQRPCCLLGPGPVPLMVGRGRRGVLLPGLGNVPPVPPVLFSSCDVPTVTFGWEASSLGRHQLFDGHGPAQ